MIRIRKAEDRGQADHGWLKTSHTFSFADYHDPQNVHFRSLRVMNEDFIAGGNGFRFLAFNPVPQVLAAIARPGDLGQVEPFEQVLGHQFGIAK